jgi:hypothetical protein
MSSLLLLAYTRSIYTIDVPVEPSAGSNQQLALGAACNILSPTLLAGQYECLAAHQYAHEPLVSVSFSPYFSLSLLTVCFVQVVAPVKQGGIGCERFEDERFEGSIVIFDRGECPFATKAITAQEANAKGLIIVDSQSPPMPPGLGWANISIPVVMVGPKIGDRLKDALTDGSDTFMSIDFKMETAQPLVAPCAMAHCQTNPCTYKPQFGNKAKDPRANNATIVTAYFEIPSNGGKFYLKHDVAAFHRWLKKMLGVRTPMVVYTDQNNAELVSELVASIRGAELMDITEIVVIDITEFLVHKYDPIFREQWKGDQENLYHTVELYKIWNEKLEFVRKVVEKNPFDSKYFFWIDLGYFRGRKAAEEHILEHNWPSAGRVHLLDDNKLLVLRMRQIHQDHCDSYETISQKFGWFGISGNLFGGTKTAVTAFHSQFYPTLEAMAEQNYFIGKDQTIYCAVACAHPDLVHSVGTCENDWSYMQDYLTE